ncbi:glycosyl transferase family protein [Salinisphaera dokdonensis CL-ES53]|uniref:Glycosyl transferase family protein n=1 Tax=Salinisphaera dokdonensis CL-ES53 TaxID=1304272 RepID=A0ABV2AX72_9GAMM
MTDNASHAIGVIVTTYNAEKFIERSLKSVLSQLGGEDRLVVVDDGSADGTVEECRRVMSAVRNATLIEMPRVGRAAALNIAIANCDTEIVAIQDADDYSLPGRLGRIRELCATTSADVFAFAYYARDEASSTEWLRRPESSHRRLLEKMASGVPICHTAAAYRRDVWSVVGGYPVNTPMIVDLPFWIKAGQSGFAFVGDDTPVSVHHYHRASNFTAAFNRIARARVLLTHNLRAFRAFGRPSREFAMAWLRFGSIFVPRSVRDAARVMATNRR